MLCEYPILHFLSLSFLSSHSVTMDRTRYNGVIRKKTTKTKRTASSACLKRKTKRNTCRKIEREGDREREKERKNRIARNATCSCYRNAYMYPTSVSQSGDELNGQNV